MSVTGAKPAGALDETGAAQAVRQMFDSIAPRYDLLNHVLSANVDRLWWWRAARTFRAILANPNAAVLDVCAGTGHMTRALLKRRPRNSKPVLAIDFARQMLLRGSAQFVPHPESPDAPRAIAIEGDALHLPLGAHSLDLVVTAFGFRNLANYEAGLLEFARVLRDGGQLGILDFSQPSGLFGKLYSFYFHRVLPAIAKMIGGRGASRADSPYAYLPASVQKFPAPAAMLDLMRACGFTECQWTPYTFGIAGLYTGVRRAD